MSVPADQMMAPPGPPMGGPSMGGMPGAPAPNLLPFASTQPQGIMALAAPLLAQQQQDQEALKAQQLEALMGVVMQAIGQMPNPAAMAAQTEPSAPLDGTGLGAEDPSVMSGGGGDSGGSAYGGAY